MKWVKGNILFYWKLGNIIVIPTNPGWRKDGSNVMGAGLSKQASILVKDLPMRYGKDCMNLSPYQYYKDLRLILVPTKPLNKEQPFLSWKEEATRDIVESSLIWLESNASSFKGNKVYVPILGTGSGKLEKGLVVTLMERILKNEKFIGVEYHI